MNTTVRFDGRSIRYWSRVFKDLQTREPRCAAHARFAYSCPACQRELEARKAIA